MCENLFNGAREGRLDAKRRASRLLKRSNKKEFLRELMVIIYIRIITEIAAVLFLYLK